jgi:hypothetical protein
MTEGDLRKGLAHSNVQESLLLQQSESQQEHAGHSPSLIALPTFNTQSFKTHHTYRKMPVPDQIYESLANNTAHSLVRQARKHNWDKETCEQLGEYLDGCEELATTGMMPDRTKTLIKQEAMTELGEMYLGLKSLIASQADDSQSLNQVGSTPLAGYPDYQLLQLGTIAGRCFAADPSWVHETAVLGLQGHCNSLPDDPEWNQPFLTEHAQTAERLTRQFLTAMSVIDGSPIEIDFGDNEPNITLDTPDSGLLRALRNEMLTQGIYPLRKFVRHHREINPVTQEVMDLSALGRTMHKVIYLANIIHIHTQAEIVNYQEGKDKSNESSGIDEDKSAIHMSRERYTKMMKPYCALRR